MNDQAIIWGTRKIDYERLEHYISAVIKHLKGRGIGFQDRVVIIEQNSIEYVIVLLSLWKMGAVACPLNPAWPYETLLQCCQKLNPKVILTGHKQFIAARKTSTPVIGLKDLISFDARQVQVVSPSEIPLEQEATVIWTSGSSDLPKAAVHTWGNHYYSALGSQEVIPLNKADRWILSLPLYHVSGISIVCRCYLAQATIVMSTQEELDHVIKKSTPTHISLVGLQLNRLMENKDNHPFLKSLKYILLGGSSIAHNLLEKALSLDLPVYVSYGLTEMASQVATGKVESLEKPSAKILPYRQLMINAQGQILVKGEVLFKGYLNQNKIFLPVDQDGWFQTRDLGRLENGFLTVLGRMDHMFICAGENIQPEEIEKVLLSSPQVKEVIVVAREDEQYGHRPVAFVRMTGVFNEDYLRNYCLQQLPKIKIPVLFYSWPKDLNQGLKVSRRFFQERIGKL